MQIGNPPKIPDKILASPRTLVYFRTYPRLPSPPNLLPLL